MDQSPAARPDATTTGSVRLRPLAVAGLAVAAALAFRLPVVARADFPVYDGGLFSVMAGEIAANGFALPRFTSYNGGDVPFAYPPLGLYVTALIHRATGIPILAIVQWLPLALSLLAVAAFAALARRLLPTARAAVLAAVIFPLLPYSYQWVIMGGGVTRALGFLFALLAATALVDASSSPSARTLALAALATAGAVLSHPEFAVFALVSAVLIPALLARGRARLTIPVGVAAAALVLSSPWWATVLARFGSAPFRAAATSTPFDLRGLVGAAVVFPFTAEPYLRVLGVLGLLGVLMLAATGRALVPAWLVLTLATIPRNGSTPLTVPIALAAAVCLDELLLPAAALAGRRSGRRWAAAAAPLAVGGWVLAYAALENWVLLQRADVLLPVLSQGEREVSNWAARHTAAGSAFLIVTSTSAEQRDPLAEWFPALAGRTSVATAQGGEWIGRFGERSALNVRVKECQAAGVECLARVADRGPAFTHVLVAREPRGPLPVERLRAELATSPGYRLLFDGAGGTVFERAARP